MRGRGGIAISRLVLTDHTQTEVLRFQDELEYGDEARWNELIRGELPQDDIDCPGASFILRFLCFLAFQEQAVDDPLSCETDYRCFSCIEGSVGIGYSVSSSKQVYQRYPFFSEYWRYLEHQVISVLGGPIKSKPLLPVLTRIVLDYALCPPNLHETPQQT